MKVIKIDNNREGMLWWMKRNKGNIYNVILVIIAIILGLWLISDVGSAAGETSITSPVTSLLGGAPITTSNISVMVKVNGSMITDSVTVRIMDYPIISRPFYPLDDGTWRGVVDVSSLSNGEYYLQAQYFKTNVLVSLSPLITIILNKPTLYGSISITVKDFNNNPISNVYVSPGNNYTNSDGVVVVGQRTLPSVVNFTLGKSGYNTTYTGDISFTDTQIISRTIIMNKVGGNLGEMLVTGYDMMMTGRGAFILVNDKFTGERINGAVVVLYDGNNVKSLPGQTVNGRVFMSVQSDQPSGIYLLEVSKSGYNDFTDSFSVWDAPVTPTPVPTTPLPTPVPTPDRKWRADVSNGEWLTNEEYLQWIEVQESRKRNETLAQQNATSTIQPSNESTFPWIFLLTCLAGVGIVGYRYRDKLVHNGFTNRLNGRLTGRKKEEYFNFVDDDTITNFDSIAPINTIKCNLCDWTMKANSDLEQSIISSILDTHKREKHPSEYAEIVKERRQ